MLHLSAAASDGLVHLPDFGHNKLHQYTQETHFCCFFLRLFVTGTPSLAIYMGWGGKINSAVGPVENKQR